MPSGLTPHCEAEASPECGGIGTQRHHLKLRRHGDNRTIWVCVWCHDWIHRNPAEAYDRNLLVHSWEQSGDS